jgi:hypothetical protein
MYQFSIIHRCFGNKVKVLSNPEVHIMKRFCAQKLKLGLFHCYQVFTIYDCTLWSRKTGPYLKILISKGLKMVCGFLRLTESGYTVCIIALIIMPDIKK